MSVDFIGNFLTIIRNGLRSSKNFVIAPHSNMVAEIAALLKNEGFIKDFLITEEGSNKKNIKIVLSTITKNGIQNLKKLKIILMQTICTHQVIIKIPIRNNYHNGLVIKLKIIKFEKYTEYFLDHDNY